MSEYKLEIKQMVEYPRCRIYREFVRGLKDDFSVRVSSNSMLYFYTVLCSYANFRSSYNGVKCHTYTIHPGEWICKIKDMNKWFRTSSTRKTVAILEKMQEQHLLIYKVFCQGQLVKYRILNWERHNRNLEYNALCPKDIGFFFMPKDTAERIVRTNKCSEMDALLDLWMNTVYNDPNVVGSDVAPVVYMRNGENSALVSYNELAERWGVSKATVSRYLRDLSDLSYLSCVSFSGKLGSIISPNGYLSTMFNVDDVVLEDEVMSLALGIGRSKKATESCVSESDDCVSKSDSCVSKSTPEKSTEKSRFFFAAQCFLDLRNWRLACMLYRLYGCKRSIKGLNCRVKDVNCSNCALVRLIQHIAAEKFELENLRSFLGKYAIE